MSKNPKYTNEQLNDYLHSARASAHLMATSPACSEKIRGEARWEVGALEAVIHKCGWVISPLKPILRVSGGARSSATTEGNRNGC